MSYVRRRIDLTIQLGTGNFGNSGYNTIRLTGLRIGATIAKYGMPSSDTADLRVYGMTLDQMNALSTLGMPVHYTRNNTISVSAGDDTSGMALVYFGVIKEAWADFSGTPDVLFNITSQTAGAAAAAPIPPSSYNGPADAAVILSSLAVQMGKKFENNGVSVILQHPYYPGTALAQVDAAARDAGIAYAIDGDTLAIWPMGGSRGSAIPLLSASTGLDGYPGYTSQGVKVRSIYNPSIVFGGTVKIVSVATGTSASPASGLWSVKALTHDLESETPGGAWFTDLEAYAVGQTPFPSGI